MPATNEPMFIASHEEAGNDGEGWHLRVSTSNTIYFVLSDHDKDNITDAVDGAIPAETWTHIVCSYDNSADKILIYINGVLRQIRTETDLGTINPDADIIIGDRRGENSQSWIGEIDSFRIYTDLLDDGIDTSAVSDADNLSTAAKGEILRNYNAGKRSHK